MPQKHVAEETCAGRRSLIFLRHRTRNTYKVPMYTSLERGHTTASGPRATSPRSAVAAGREKRLVKAVIVTARTGGWRGGEGGEGRGGEGTRRPEELGSKAAATACRAH